MGPWASNCTVEARKLERERPPAPNHTKNDSQHESSYVTFLECTVPTGLLLRNLSDEFEFAVCVDKSESKLW